MTGFDVVVVGAGSAGCVLAARLSEDPARRVLLLEGGAAPRALADEPTALLDAGRVPGAVADGGHNRWFDAELAPGRPWSVSRGRVLGGSSATNGAYFVRPRRADLDRWSAGADGPWAWARVLPVLRALERDLDHGATAVHGGSGPVPVRRGSLEHPLAAAFTEAALRAGHPAEPDKNDEGVPGVGPLPSNGVHGVRWSSALTHLLPALGRANLAVRGGATVRRVLVQHGRAVGVEVESAGVVERVGADAVVLAAGALASPALLLRSGIGPGDALRAAGVRPLVDAPGVGAAFGDHPQVVVEWLPAHGSPRPQGSWAGGLLTAVSTGGDPAGDLEVLESLRPMAELTGGHLRERRVPLPLLVAVHAPVPSGRLSITSPDGPAVIRFGYLADADARRRLRDGVRVAAAVVEHARADGAAEGLVGLAPEVLVDDGALDGWIRARLGTALHTCATVPFRLRDGTPGPVDEVGRVRGVAGLRVADTSILPTAPLRGPAVAALLVGEVVAASMRSAA